MKKSLPFLFLCLFVFLLPGKSFAQAYSNAWINYSQTYYKFKILTDQHVYKIPYTTLSAVGLTAIQGNQFTLYKNGKEVPVYVTTEGALTDTDYIEFYGTRNDGWVDSGLYQRGTQTNTQFSLFTDSAAYYLTYSVGNQQHLHYKPVVNTLTGHNTPQPYCFYRVAQVYGQRNSTYLFTYAAYVNAETQLPEFYPAEGYLDVNLIENLKGLSTYGYTFYAPYVDTAGPPATVTGQVCGYNSYDYIHQIKVGLGTDTLYQIPNFYGDAVASFTYNTNKKVNDLKQISSSTRLFFSCQASTSTFDYDFMSNMALQYPRLFNFDNNSVFRFMVPGPSSGNQFLAIKNYNAKGTTPFLFDTTNLVFMRGLLNAAKDSVYFNLPSTTKNRVLVITSQDPSDVATINGLQKLNFVDYTNPANEGDFIIISNSVLYNDGSGNNYVQQYADFKNSCGFHSVVADINQLYDQFAYGVVRHPLAIRNFALYARQHWTTKPKYILLIGKGVEWQDFNNNGGVYLTDCLVPTYGEPGSDILFTATNYDPTPSIPVGRLSTINPADIGAYLQKAKDFVSNQTTIPSGQTIENKLWMKDILHFAGGSGALQQATYQSYLLGYQTIIDSTFYGGHVWSFYKTSSDPIQQATSTEITSIINNGVSLMTFFGHASPNSFDYNIDPPGNFNNYKKYPMLLSNGCYLGDIFAIQPTPTLSEQWVNIPNKGAIAFVGSSYVAYDYLLGAYSRAFYKGLCEKVYHNGIGDAMLQGIHYVMDSDANSIAFIYRKLAAEEMTLNGDPSLGLNNHPKPDYVLEPSVVHFSPAVITAATDSFHLVVYPTNIGMAIDTSIYISVTRTFPDGNVSTLYVKKIKAPYYQDTMQFNVNTGSLEAYGLNKFTITIDSKNQIDEITKTNNSVTVYLYINGEDIVPAYPYNYSIVNQQNILNNKGLVLKASTINPFAKIQMYHMQIDTTAMFNSPFLLKRDSIQTAGVVKWRPKIALHDSIVYYWRVAVDTNNRQYNWHTYSFIYLPKSSPGWNQSHYYQYLNDNYGDILDSSDRTFRFIKTVENINATTGVSQQFGNGPLPYDQIAYYINSAQALYDNVAYGPCGVKTTFMIAVLDSASGLPLTDPQTGKGCGGLYASMNNQTYALNGFFFNSIGAVAQDSIAVFINKHIPKSDFVLGFSIDQGGIELFNSNLLNALKTLGCTRIDTTTFDRPYMFFGKKNGGKAFPTVEILADSADKTISGNFVIKGNWHTGYVQSPLIGPAQQWTSFHWKHHTLLKTEKDSASVTIFGVNNTGASTLLYKAFTGADLALNFINPKIYPNIIVQENTTDTSYHRTPAQLNYLRVNYQPVPDAAVNPSAYLSVPTDTPFQQGEPFIVGIDVVNITDYNMDSLWMKYAVTASGGNPVSYFVKDHPLGANDSLHARFNYTIPGVSNSGISNLLIEANPYEHHQPEEYHYNNIADLPFNVRKDVTNPILDVTFDGIHILNNDIISSKPDIIMRLKDENKYLALNDTSDVKVFIEYPGSTTPIPVHYNNGATMIFTPAPRTGLSATNNICTIEYKPYFNVDGPYTFIVQAHDSAGNVSGSNAYQVAFEVVNEEMISSILNYPNPFTTSTRFVFTLTGSQIPTYFKIEIMTITGKIIKEITLNDIGPLHIGSNISQYAWNGTDQYGNPVGNGLYLYHVVASLNGQAIAHYNSGADQYIKSGFGKMYLLR